MMRKIRQIFIFTFSVFLLTFAANAQDIGPSYGFVEVIDFKNNPVADALVASRGSSEKTNQSGRLEKGIMIHNDSAETEFFIEKAGFFTFTDYYGLFDFLKYRWRTNRENPLIIELLKIPKNKAERKINGKQQEMRAFFGAARRGDAVQVRKFIKSGLNPNLTTSDLRGIPTEKDIPIIIYAVKSGNGKAVEEFLSAGVKVNKPDEPIKSILMRYLATYPSRGNRAESDEKGIISDYEAGAIKLIEKGANINPTEKGAVTPLMIAAQKQYVQIAEKLLKKGAIVDAQDRYGRTALMYSVGYRRQGQRLEIADLLIKGGANVNLLTSEIPYAKYDNLSCKTALAVAVENYDVELVELLLESGADANFTCKGGLTPLNYAKELSNYVAKNEKNKIIELLEKAGAK